MTKKALVVLSGHGHRGEGLIRPLETLDNGVRRYVLRIAAGKHLAARWRVYARQQRWSDLT